MNTTVKKANTFLAFLLMLAIIISTGFLNSVFAMNPGESINYSMTYGRSIAIFGATKGDIAYQGVCCEPDSHAVLTGTASVVKTINNDSWEAKMIYNMVYNYGWIDANHYDVSAKEVLGLDYDTVATLGGMVIDVGQISQAGVDRWYAANREAGVTDRTLQACLNWYNSQDVSGITVPKDFKMYYMDAGSDQDFLMFAIEPPPTGFVKLKKASANTGITG